MFLGLAAEFRGPQFPPGLTWGPESWGRSPSDSSAPHPRVPGGVALSDCSLVGEGEPAGSWEAWVLSVAWAGHLPGAEQGGAGEEEQGQVRVRAE